MKFICTFAVFFSICRSFLAAFIHLTKPRVQAHVIFIIWTSPKLNVLRRWRWRPRQRHSNHFTFAILFTRLRACFYHEDFVSVCVAFLIHLQLSDIGCHWLPLILCLDVSTAAAAAILFLYPSNRIEYNETNFSLLFVLSTNHHIYKNLAYF